MGTMADYNDMFSFIFLKDKGAVHPKIKNTHFLLPVELFISLDSFGVSYLVMEISAVKISAFSQV